MSLKRQKDVQLRVKALALLSTGLSQSAVAEELNCSRTIVRNALRKQQKGIPIEDAPRSGRPSKLNARTTRAIVKNLNKDRGQSSSELLKTTFGTSGTASSRTIRRALGKVGFKRCRARASPLLTYIQQLKRRRWAVNFKHYDFSKVVFSDEKRFARRPDGPMMVWRRVGESRDYRCTRKHTKFGGGGIMVWGAIGLGHRFPLIRVTGTLDAAEYINQILRLLVPQLPRASRRRLVFMQDSAAPHTAASTTRFLRENNVEVLPEWPSNSPDLNPIENVWGYLEKRLKHRVCTSDNDLWELLQQEWNAIPSSLIKSLYESMPKRLKEVRKCKGQTIKY
jgi:transposase